MMLLRDSSEGQIEKNRDVSRQALGTLHDTLHMARCLENMVLCIRKVLWLYVVRAGKC